MNNFPPSVCCGEKKAGGPIGTNSFGDSGFVVLWCVKRETCKTETVLDFLGRVRCERCGFWILLLFGFSHGSGAGGFCFVIAGTCFGWKSCGCWSCDVFDGWSRLRSAG